MRDLIAGERKFDGEPCSLTVQLVIVCQEGNNLRILFHSPSLNYIVVLTLGVSLGSPVKKVLPQGELFFFHKKSPFFSKAAQSN